MKYGFIPALLSRTQAQTLIECVENFIISASVKSGWAVLAACEVDLSNFASSQIFDVSSFVLQNCQRQYHRMFCLCFRKISWKAFLTGHMSGWSNSAIICRVCPFWRFFWIRHFTFMECILLSADSLKTWILRLFLSKTSKFSARKVLITFFPDG